jgi:hypothetical protein
MTEQSRDTPQTAEVSAGLDAGESLLARGGARPRAYGPDSQIFVFGVHGTLNNADNISGLTHAIGNAYHNTGRYGNVLIDSSFSWEDNAQLTNGPSGHRRTAAQTMAPDLLSKLQEAYGNGSLDRSKPLVVNLVGFSHGGNVALQGADELSEGLKQIKQRYGVPDIALHITTASTPAYNKAGNPENPDVARSLVQADGIKFAHTAFSVENDQVIWAARGQGKFSSNATFNSPTLPAAYEHRLFGDTDGARIANHGAPQDLPYYQNVIAGRMAERFRALEPPQQQRRAEIDEDTPIGQRVKQVASDNGGDRRLAAAAVHALIDQPGFDPALPVGVVTGTGGQKIATQGDGPLSVNARIDPNAGERELATRLAATAPANERSETLSAHLGANPENPALKRA